MKQAKEWIKYLDPNTSSESCCYSPVPIEDIKQIQLDSFKAGERFAAGIADKAYGYTGHNGNSIASDAILTDANNRTKLP